MAQNAICTNETCSEYDIVKLGWVEGIPIICGACNDGLQMTEREPTNADPAN